MQQTIIVTGGAGYIGSPISYLLYMHGYHVIILDDFRYHQSKKNLSFATIIEDDYGNPTILDELFTTHSIAGIMHCAGSIEVGKSVTDPHEFYTNNITKTITLLDRMRVHNIRNIIFSSSCAVYGTPSIIPITEDHVRAPISPYGNTKLMIEMILADYDQAYTIPYVALRYFNAAGALPELQLGEQHEPETHLIPLIFRALRTKKPFTIFGNDYQTPDGTCIRDFLHVLDIAHAHLQALNYLHRGHPSMACNLGTGNGYSVQEIINTIEQITQLHVPTRIAEKRAGDPPYLVASAARAHDLLSWKPRYSDIANIIKSAYIFDQSSHQHANRSPTSTNKTTYEDVV